MKTHITGDKEAHDKAIKMVGAGDEKTPMFFIHTSNDYLFDSEEGVDYFSSAPDEAPLKLKTLNVNYLPIVYSWEEAKDMADNIELYYDVNDPENSIMNVTVEDRRTGTCYERNIQLKMKISQNERNLENGSYADKIYGK